MAASAPGHVRLPEGEKKNFKEYPDTTLEGQYKHGEYVERRHGLEVHCQGRT